VQGRESRDVLLVVDGRAFTAAQKKKVEKLKKIKKKIAYTFSWCLMAAP
jgi:membrane-bound lytic murein transglycosylase MltF